MTQEGAAVAKLILDLDPFLILRDRVKREKETRCYHKIMQKGATAGEGNLFLLFVVPAPLSA